MIQYTVVQGSVLPALLEVVNDLLKKGWKLQGGVTASAGYTFQALVKEEDLTVANKTVNNVMQMDNKPRPLEGRHVSQRR